MQYRRARVSFEGKPSQEDGEVEVERRPIVGLGHRRLRCLGIHLAHTPPPRPKRLENRGFCGGRGEAAGGEGREEELAEEGKGRKAGGGCVGRTERAVGEAKGGHG